MVSIQADPQAGLLEWARKDAGLTIEQVANRLGVDPGRLRQWESGRDAPTIAKLREMAGIYHRPLATFYLPQPPTPTPALPDYRTLDGTSAEQNPQLRLAIREAADRQDAAVELAEALRRRPRALPVLRAALGAERFGNELREVLDVSITEQRSWTSQYDALWGWIAAAEKLGILVSFVPGIELRFFRGFSLAHDQFPVVGINSKESPRARVFTLLHELAHLTLRQAGICDQHEAPTETDVEVFCNAAAAAALMPKDRFLMEPEVALAEREEEWTEDDLEDLAQRYTASREAVLRRLLTVGKTTRAFYERKRAEWQSLSGREDGGGFARYEYKKLGEVGSLYAGLGFEAFERGAISQVALGRYLDVKLKHLEPIRRAWRSRTE